MQQESSSLLSSDMASIYLPMMLVVFKCIVYGAFIFLVPMLLVGGGWGKYQSYLIVVISLQLWPALNAILNMIIETYSSLTQGSSLIMSYSTASTIYKRVDTIVSVAAGLQMIIPFLAFWLTKLGGEGVMNLAGNIVGSMQSISGSIGAETATNNRSLDNLSIGNQQRNMINSNKTDENMSYFSGVNHGQYSDGTGETLTAGGQQVFSGGAGSTSSVGNRKLNDEESVQAQISQGTQVMDSILDSDRRSHVGAKSSTISKTVDSVDTILEKMQMGQSFNFDQLGEQGKSAKKLVSHAQNFVENYGYSNRQAAEMAVKASASASTPLKGLTGVGISGSIDGSVSAGNETNQGLQDSVNDSHNNNTSEDYNNLVNRKLDERTGNRSKCKRRS